jgi:hypothetical protein
VITIVAVPVARMGDFYVNASEQQHYRAQVVWWHWSCMVCGAESRPRALFSHAGAALERGHNWHLAREQCDVQGQLSLFGGIQL